MPRTSPKRKPNGRKPGTPVKKYHASYPDMVRGACFQGATLQDIAEMLGVAKATVQRWAKGYPEFGAALNARRLADDKVVESLFNRAIGYEYEEETRELRILCYNADGEEVPPDSPDVVTTVKDLDLVKKVKKREAPNVTAQVFWLKNRRPEDWRDKLEVEEVNPEQHVARLQQGRKRIAEARKLREQEVSGDD